MLICLLITANTQFYTLTEEQTDKLSVERRNAHFQREGKILTPPAFESLSLD